MGSPVGRFAFLGMSMPWLVTAWRGNLLAARTCASSDARTASASALTSLEMAPNLRLSGRRIFTRA
eukprot:3971208-Pyramimonas_sp.AAC.1